MSALVTCNLAPVSACSYHCLHLLLALRLLLPVAACACYCLRLLRLRLRLLLPMPFYCLSLPAPTTLLDAATSFLGARKAPAMLLDVATPASGATRCSCNASDDSIPCPYHTDRSFATNWPLLLPARTTPWGHAVLPQRSCNAPGLCNVVSARIKVDVKSMILQYLPK